VGKFQGDEAALEKAFDELKRAERLVGSKGDRVVIRDLNSPKRVIEQIARIAQDPSEPGKTRTAALKEVYRLSGFPVPKQLDSYEQMSDGELGELFRKTLQDAIQATKCAYWVVVEPDGTESRVKQEVPV
jgi:hypothetical protein